MTNQSSSINEVKKFFNAVGCVFSLAFTLMRDSIGKLIGRSIVWIQQCCGTTAKTASVTQEALKSQFYIIGGGIAGLNTALLLLQEGVSGRNITILEENHECGGIFYRQVADNGKSFFAHTVRTFDEPSYHYAEKAWRQAGIWNTDHLISRNHAQPRQTGNGVRPDILAFFMKLQVHQSISRFFR